MNKLNVSIRFMLLFALLHGGLALTSAGSGGLKFVRVQVPQYRAPGDSAILICEYDLGNDSLYSVKWYKDYEEFYKYVPKSKPPEKSYNVSGVIVDMSKSHKNRVILRNVSFQTTGLYRCEVSAEAPSFSSAQSEARLEVMSLPEEDPVISGEKDQYQINEVINLNCTSGKSRPASIIHWYINEQKVPLAGGALIHYPIEQHQYGLVTSTLGLRFKLTSNHFLGGSMKIKCVALMQPILWRGDSQSVVKSPMVREMREALILVRSSSNRILASHTWLILISLICFSIT